MAALTDNSVCLLSTTTGVDMKTGSTTLYTVPVGKSLIIDKVVVRTNSASLAGGTSYSFTNWLQTVDLSGMTTTTGSRTLWPVTNTTYVINTTGTAVQITVTTGSTGAATAALMLYGTLF